MSQSRCGFSLIEMLVATAIVLVSVGVLSELAGVGQRHARAAEDAATAQRLCQNLLEGILCGGAPLETTQDAVVKEDPDWTYSVELKPLDDYAWEPGLAELRVTVTKTSEAASPSRSFSLVRWIRQKSPQYGEVKPTPDASADTDEAMDRPPPLRLPARVPSGGPRP
jgi:prepilin-type N-terminal cleavage/methylation domain-containing protein